MLFEYCVLICELFLLKTVKILQTAIAECFWPFFFLFLPKIKSCHFKLWGNLGFIFSSKGFLCSHSLEICLSIYPEGSGHLLQIK